MSKELLQILLEKYKAGQLSRSEKEQLAELVHSANNREVLEAILDEDIKLSGGKGDIESMELIYRQLMQAKEEMENGAVIIPFYKRAIVKWVAAAAVVLLVAGGWWLREVSRSTGHDKPDVVATNDVKPPAINRAMITLADGRIVYLDSASNGTLATENNVNLIKKADCEIVYDDSRLTAHDSPLTYNTLTNPRGSKVIDMTLSDGSKVWLNAGSSVKYPVTFIGKDRKVEITGEAYFEVTHDPGRPFVVSKGLISVTVLGTHFNVNAYDDEADIKVTLLEGSVKVSELTTHHSQLIKPGEQGIAMNNGELTVKNDVDMEQVMAWKNGRFQFNEADLQTVLRQVARWYDVEIVYEGDVPTRQFGGKMQKELNLSEILKILEKNNVHFRIDGKKLIVLK